MLKKCTFNFFISSGLSKFQRTFLYVSVVEIFFINRFDLKKEWIWIEWPHIK